MAGFFICLIMTLRLKKILRKFLIWKYKHISERNFIYALSILVGFLSGLIVVLLKNLTHLYQLLLEIDWFNAYKASMYFIFPILGLVLVYTIKQIWLKKHIGHGISTTLHAIS